MTPMRNIREDPRNPRHPRSIQFYRDFHAAKFLPILD
jgi:hypothetical protein